MTKLTETVALICLVWVVAIVFIQIVGTRAIFRNFKRQPSPPVSPQLRQSVPHVTIIRPVKGIEPQLYECITSTFLQDYPSDSLSIRLCVEDESDPAYPILQQAIDDFPDLDARILVERQDSNLSGPTGHVDNLGPNPKIRNISRAYREAKEIVWIIDCNVWVASSVMGRMVDKLMGYTMSGRSARPYKFVHQLPLVVDLVDYSVPPSSEGQTLLTPASEMGLSSEPTVKDDATIFERAWSQGGGRLDEMFMATSHAKFYGAINLVGVAPCIVGKSNMFRKSHLDQATDPAKNPNLSKDTNRPTGVDYFSHNICEDHLIGELLWHYKLPGYHNHGLVWGDLAVQPMCGMAVAAYAARRARWLRARKFTVMVATAVEPGIEAFLCSAYFAFAVTTLPYFHKNLGVPQTFSAMGLIWLACLALWIMLDWSLFRRLHSGLTIPDDSNIPYYVRGLAQKTGLKRQFVDFFFAWLGREALALPIWIWAVALGTTVHWRGKTFAVRYDATVVELTKDDQRSSWGSKTPELERATSRNKRRVD